MKEPTLFFDLGNTLLYNRQLDDENIQIACRHAANAFTRLGYQIRANDLAAAHFHNLTRYYAIRNSDFIEQSAELILNQTLEEFGFFNLPAKDIQAAIRAFYAYTQSNWRLVDGVPSLLKSLRKDGYPLGLISNASSTGDVLTLLKNHRLMEYFAAIIVSADVGFRKPRREIYGCALKKLNARPESAVMIGDTFIADILGAKQIGMKAVWATRYAKAEQVVLPDIHADFNLDDITRLKEVIELI